MKHCTYIFIFLLTGLLMLNCGGTKVTRTDPGEVIDLSGEWNDTDSQKTAETMIEQCLNSPWIDEFVSQNRRKPTMTVGPVKNKSYEHINTETFMNDLERALINSRQVKFVASRSERSDLRDEKKDQDLHSSDETRKSMNEETGADFMVMGTLNSIIDKEGNKSVKYYQVDLDLIHIETHEKVWALQKKIKKYVKKARARP